MRSSYASSKTRDMFQNSEIVPREIKGYYNRLLLQKCHSPGIMLQYTGNSLECITSDTRAWQSVGCLPMEGNRPSSARHHKSHLCWWKYVPNKFGNIRRYASKIIVHKSLSWVWIVPRKDTGLPESLVVHKRIYPYSYICCEHAVQIMRATRTWVRLCSEKHLPHNSKKDTNATTPTRYTRESCRYKPKKLRCDQGVVLSSHRWSTERTPEAVDKQPPLWSLC